MRDFKSILQEFDPISLSEMDGVKLMNRTDTKCAFSEKQLEEILRECKSSYRVLEHEGTRAASYETLYFDTPHHQLYLDHHNERAKRFKIRIRNYVESKLFFLEVKYKKYGRTDKKRIKINGLHEKLEPLEQSFVESLVGKKIELVPMLWNNFNRITLVNKFFPERVTIDFGLRFRTHNNSLSLDHLIIAEIKQENLNRHSPFIQVMKEKGIREASMSKYCIGSALLEKDIKYNNFKERILKIEKLKAA